MILSEEYVKVPGKLYKVKVQCVSTRRLTTMEWLIVNCAARFQAGSVTSNKKLKYVFEEIFQLTSSEILIKPCIQSLMNEQAILLDVGATFDYSDLTFSQIRLTEKGKKMAEDGLFPGEIKELPLDIYYNPLTEKMNQFVGGNEKVDDALEFGTESDYEDVFPEEKVIEALHKGLVGRGKFVASKLRIEEIECLASSDWDNYIKLEVALNDDDIITTNPLIKEAGVKKLVANLLFSKELSSSKVASLEWISDAEPKKVLGSGRKIKEAVLDISKNGSIVGIDEAVYSLYKRNTTAFKYKTIFIWGAKKFDIRKENETCYIDLPFVFDVNGCSVINEKNESVSICKKTFKYDEYEFVAPLAFSDKRIKVGEHNLLDWLERNIEDNCNEFVEYIALFSLKIFAKSEEKAVQMLIKRWDIIKTAGFYEDLKAISDICSLLGTDMIKLDNYGEEIWSRFSDLETQDILDKLGEIMQLNCISSGSETQKYILKKILERANKPKTYNELFVMLQSVGIRTHTDALMYDELIGGLYTRELIIDTFRVILEGKYTKLPELFELDILFNEYVQAIKELEFLISDLQIFGNIDPEIIENAMEKCADIALIQSYAAEINAKNALLLNYGINVYTELKNIDISKAENFFNNLDIIKQKVVLMMKEETKAVVSNVTKKAALEDKKLSARMYIVDTCALIHHPELLLYFADDEYVRIPTKVIDELGKIKDMRSPKYSPDLSRTATRLAYDIERKYLKLFNLSNKMRLMIENAELDLLPAELDKNVPDNQILSVALKYVDWDVFIISDDGVFRLTSIAQNIKAITADDFIAEHEIYKKTLDRWVEKFAKAGGVLNLQSAAPLAKPKEELQIALVKNDTNEAINSLEQKNFSDPLIDALPIRELKKYLASDLTEPVFTLLQNNGIKTIGQFRDLTPTDASGLKAKGKQTVLRNNVIRAINKFKAMQDVNDDGNDEKSNADEEIPEAESKEVTLKGYVTNVDSEQILKYIEVGDYEGAQSEFDTVTADLNRNEKAVYLRKVYLEADEKTQTNFLRYLIQLYPNWMVRMVTGDIGGSDVERIKKNTDFQYIVNELIEKDELDKFGNIMTDWKLVEKFEEYFPNLSKEELLLKINSLASIRVIFKECITEADKVLEFISTHEKLCPEAVIEECAKRISATDSKSPEFVKFLCEYFKAPRDDAKKSLSLSIKDVVELAIKIPVEEEDLLKTLVEDCSNASYKLEINKHYAQAEPTARTIEPLLKMINAKLPSHRVIYIYMNTKLRGELNIDRVIQEMTQAGYDLSEVLNEIKDYWILGKVKYVQDDGLVRVASGSVSNSRLMVFNSSRIYINGENGWEKPVEGMNIYFKIQDFLDGGLFYIHYPCTDIAYSN